MAEKLQILFKILITLLISFKTECQSIDEDPNENELKQIIKDWESNLPEQYDTNLPDPIINTNVLEQFPIDSKMLEQFNFDNIDEELKEAKKMSDDVMKMNEELSKIDFKPAEFNPSHYELGVVRFKASDLPYLILYGIAYIAAALVFSSILMLIVHCVKKKRSTQSSNSRLSLWLFAFKNTADPDEKESSGDAFDHEEPKKDKTLLIKV